MQFNPILSNIIPHISKIFVSIGEELFFLLLIGLDGLRSGLPVGWAHFTMLVGELESFDKSDSLIDRPSNGSIVDLYRSDFLLSINNENASECGSEQLIVCVIDEHAVVLAQLLADVCQQWIVDLAEPTFGPWRLDPCQVREVRICRDAENFSSDVLELFEFVRECDQFRRANVSEVKGIEDQHQVLALIVV